MNSNQPALTNLTAILPNSTAQRVMQSTLAGSNIPTFVSKARGTLLQDHWLKRLFPPISPVKTIIEMLVSSHEVDEITNTIVKESRLDQQAIGAIFSTNYENAYSGNASPIQLTHQVKQANSAHHELDGNLRIIYCIVNHNLSDKVAKAAIDIGAHGPIIYYSEGRGLRDRLGWLRITKEHEKEVLMIITDAEEGDEIFDAIAKAGEFHLPGRGFMYSLPIEKGMFNLPSRMSHHHYDASMQQIIHAIDQLSGHTHWRDQAIFNLGAEGRYSGFEFIKDSPLYLTDHECVTAITVRSNLQPIMGMMLDLNAPGVNISFSRCVDQSAHTKISEEYVKIQSIMNAELSQKIYQSIASNTQGENLDNVFCGVTKVPLVATYLPSKKDYRASPPKAA